MSWTSQPARVSGIRAKRAPRDSLHAQSFALFCCRLYSFEPGLHAFGTCRYRMSTGAAQSPPGHVDILCEPVVRQKSHLFGNARLPSTGDRLTFCLQILQLHGVFALI
jgi:hypothetical protein